jgi:hypothetical protein
MVLVIVTRRGAGVGDSPRRYNHSTGAAFAALRACPRCCGSSDDLGCPYLCLVVS